MQNNDLMYAFDSHSVNIKENTTFRVKRKNRPKALNNHLCQNSKQNSPPMNPPHQP
jgi:hypothetical protein